MTQCNIYPCLIYSRNFCRISASKEVVELYSPTPFGAMLKQLREEVGMSQGELADELGKTAQYISNIEKGKNNSPPDDANLD